VGGDQRKVDVAGLFDRLAVIDRLEHRQFPGALLDDAGDSEQVLGPVGAAHGAPHGLVGAPRGPDGIVHIGGIRLGHLGQHLLGGRVDGLARLARAGIPELTVDEQPVRGLDVHNGA